MQCVAMSLTPQQSLTKQCQGQHSKLYTAPTRVAVSLRCRLHCSCRPIRTPKPPAPTRRLWRQILPYTTAVRCHHCLSALLFLAQPPPLPDYCCPAPRQLLSCLLYSLPPPHPLPAALLPPAGVLQQHCCHHLLLRGRADCCCRCCLGARMFATCLPSWASLRPR